VQYARVLALGNQRPVMPAWRWRVLHSPADAPRFMITDRGWMYVGMEDWPTHGLLLPMGPRVAILGYLDDPGLPPRRPAFEEHLDLCQSTIDYLNAAAWDDPYIELMVAHPGDQSRLAALPDPPESPHQRARSLPQPGIDRPVRLSARPPTRWPRPGTAPDATAARTAGPLIHERRICRTVTGPRRGRLGGHWPAEHTAGPEIDPP
jgi:hypothetical protein